MSTEIDENEYIWAEQLSDWIEKKEKKKAIARERSLNYIHKKMSCMTPQERREYWKRQYFLARTRRHKDKQELLAMFGNRCQICGFSDKRALQFHHKNGKNDTNKLSRKYRTLKNEKDNLMLVCANCHWIIHDGKTGGKGRPRIYQ